MKIVLQVDVTFDQILSMVKQLPLKQKLHLMRELEREFVGSRLSQLLKALKTNELTLETIDVEVERVRQEIYESKAKALR